MSETSQLPNELWLEILQLAVYVPALLSPAVVADAGVSPWIRHYSTDQSMKTRKAIVQVCRAWWALGVELLYEYIRVSKAEEVESIVQCFEQSAGGASTGKPLVCPNKEGYGWWTKRLDIRANLVANTDVLPNVQRLLTSCHNVRVLDITPAPDHPILGETKLHSLATLAGDRFGHSLQRFTLNFAPEKVDSEGEFSYRTLIPHLPLDTIDIQFNSISAASTSSINQEQIRAFDTVSTLGISLNSSISSFPSWRCPSLRHLQFMYIVASDLPSLKPFLQINGGQITSLSLFIGESYRFDTHAFARLLSYFPNLRSLGYNPVNIILADSELSASITTLRLTLLTLDDQVPSKALETQPDSETLTYGIRDSFPNISTIMIEDGPRQRLIEEGSTWKTFIAWCHHDEHTYQVLDADGYSIPPS